MIERIVHQPHLNDRGGCPENICPMSSVWSTRDQQWQCPRCDWPQDMFRKRVRQLDKAREAYHADQARKGK